MLYWTEYPFLIPILLYIICKQNFFNKTHRLSYCVGFHTNSHLSIRPHLEYLLETLLKGRLKARKLSVEKSTLWVYLNPWDSNYTLSANTPTRMQRCIQLSLYLLRYISISSKYSLINYLHNRPYNRTQIPDFRVHSCYLLHSRRVMFV